MTAKLDVLVWAVVALVMFVTIALNIIKGGIFDLMWATVMIAPFIFMLFIRARPIWHVLILISLAAGRLRIPIYGLEQLNPLLLVSLMVLAAFIVETALQHGSKNRVRIWEEWFILLIAIGLSVRFFYDRPGFVALGAAEGGFMSAINMVLSAWSFFAVKSVASRAMFSRSQLKGASLVVCLLFIYAMFHQQFFAGRLFTRAMGETESWMLAAIVLSLIMTSRSIQLKSILFYLVSFLFLFMATISTYRARVMYILSEMLIIAHFAKAFRKTLLVLLTFGTLGVMLAIVFQDYMPIGMRRFLSLFTDVEVELQVVGAYGWADSFRGELYRMAWEEILMSPLFGRGFGLNVEEALAILAVGTNITFLEILALGRSYHNTYVVLAVTVGIPITALFLIISIAIPFRFSRFLWRITDGPLRTWGMVVMGFYCATMAMNLLNGSPREFFLSMNLLGLMVGMMRNPQGLPAKPEPDGALIEREFRGVSGSISRLNVTGPHFMSHRR